MAEERLIFNSLVVMTTFDEAREMIEELLEAGVTELDVTLVGWTKGGYAGRYPRRLPVERAFGGERGLREFAEWAHEARHSRLPPGQLHRRLRRQRGLFPPDRGRA